MASTGRSTKQIQIQPTGMYPAVNGAPMWVQNLTRLGADGGWVTRGGFGLCAAIDSSLTTGRNEGDSDTGIRSVIGTTTLEAKFGHDLVLALVRSESWLTNSDQNYTSRFGVVYELVVYDATYDEVTRHTLHHHTSEPSIPVWQRRGNYNTDAEVDNQDWYDAGSGDYVGDRSPVDTEEAFWAVDPTGHLVFGTTRLGAWLYSPGLPSNAPTTANTVFPRETAPARSEDASVTPLTIRDGIFGEGSTYLTVEEFGRPTAATMLGERMVYAVGNLLYYSDPGEPSAIDALNVDQFSEDITAVISRWGVIYAFSKNRTWLINPSSGAIISGGRIVEISNTVGCINPNTVTELGASITFVHTSGVYGLSGSTAITKISDPIDTLFVGEGVEAPWSQFRASSVSGIGSGELPRTYYSWGVHTHIHTHLASDSNGRLFFSVPEFNLTFVLEESGWSVWNYETVANGVPNVSGTNNIPKPRVVCLRDRVFLTTDISTLVATDKSKVDGLETGYVSTSSSFGILELDRGGGLDRSSGVSKPGTTARGEDKRAMFGEYRNNGVNLQTVPLRDAGYWVMGKPIEIPSGTKFSWSGQTAGADYFYVPIELIVPTASIATPGTDFVRSVYLHFSFDNTNYELVTNTSALNAYEALYNIPTSRLGTQPAYSLGTATIATPEGVIVFDTVTGLPSDTGNSALIYIDSAIGGAWTGYPNFNMRRRYKNPVINLVFRRKSSEGALFSLGVEYIDGSVGDSNLVTTNVEGLVWTDTIKPVRSTWYEVDDSKAQAVDWTIHGHEISADGAQIKARGVTMELQGSGQATFPEVAANWPQGLLNVSIAANRKDVSGQHIDISPDLTVPGYTAFGSGSVRARVGEPAVEPVFDNVGNTWGNDGDPSAGTFLIADGATDTITTSGRMKGDKLSVSIWGHVRDKAERIKVLSTKVIARIIGGAPRRRGRE